MKLLFCILFGHVPIRKWYSTWTDYGYEHDDEWECSRCQQCLSTLFDETTLLGRLKSWWYQE